MASVHLISGDDELLLQRATEQLLETIRAGGDVDVEVHDAQETEHLPEMRTASLFGGRTCLVVRSLEAARAELKGEIEEYLEAPDEDSILVLVVRGTRDVQKIVRLARACGDVTEVKLPADWDDGAWLDLVRSEFARLGRAADAAAYGAILEHAGRDATVIATKVAQVAAATEAGRPVAVDDVERTVEGHGRQSGFALADAVADRDPATALVVLRGALEAGLEPLALVGALVYRFRQLLQVRGGASQQEAGMSPGMYRRTQATARRFHPGELAWCHDRLAQLDVDLKGACELPAHLTLELAVLDLATSREVGLPFNPVATA